MSTHFQCFSIGSGRELCSTRQTIPPPPSLSFSWFDALLFRVAVALYSLAWVCMGPHISPPLITSSSLSSRSPPLSFSQVTDMFGGKKSVISHPRLTVRFKEWVELMISDTHGLLRKPVRIRTNTSALFCLMSFIQWHCPQTVHRCDVCFGGSVRCYDVRFGGGRVEDAEIEAETERIGNEWKSEGQLRFEDEVREPRLRWFGHEEG